MYTEMAFLVGVGVKAVLLEENGSEFNGFLCVGIGNATADGLGRGRHNRRQ